MNSLRIPLVAALVLVGPGIALLPGQPNIDLHPFPSDKGMWGFGTRPDDMKIPAKYRYASPFSFAEKLAVVQDGEKFLYITPADKNAFGDQTFAFAGPFVGGVACIKAGEKFLLIDKNGKPVTKERYDELGDASEGRIIARVGKDYQFLDLQGTKMFAVEGADAVGDFSGGYAWFRRKDKFGYVDRMGKEIIPPVYDAAGNFVLGKAPARKGEKYGYISPNPKQDFVIPAEFDAASPFVGNLAVVQVKGKFGVINALGQPVIKLEYDHAALLSPNAAEVRRGEDVQLCLFGLDGTVTWTKATPRFVPVSITSTPGKARVYIVRYVDGNEQRLSAESLMTKYTQRGNTTYDEPLDRFGYWHVLCAWTDPKTGRTKIQRRDWRYPQKSVIHIEFQ